MSKVLVAASLEGYHRLRAVLRDLDADYATSYAGGVEALLQNQYSQVVVDVAFADSRTREFARLAKEQQPCARVLGVNVTGQRGGLLPETEVIDLTQRWKEQERRQAYSDRRAGQRPTGPGDRRHQPLRAML
jgi:hypothetical protein